MTSRSHSPLLLCWICLLFFIPPAQAQFHEIVLQDDSYTVLNGVHFTSDSTGYAVGIYDIQYGMIIRTQDAGQSWDTTAFPPGQFRAIHFPTPDTGYTAGRAGIFRTTDGGNQWDSTDFSDLLQQIEYKEIYFTNANTGFATIANGGSYFAQTYDGNHWADSSGLHGASGAVQLHFPTTSTGYAVASGLYSKTVDGGQSWITEPIGDHWYTSYSTVHFVNEDVGFLGGIGAHGDPNFNFGVIAKTTDGGTTWEFTRIEHLRNVRRIEFLTDSIGIAMGGPNGGSLDIVYFAKTEDAGATWHSIDFDYTTTPQLRDLHCPTASTCYAVGGRGFIAKTTNAGGPLGELVAVSTKEAPTTQQDLRVYPNPASSHITIDAPIQCTVRLLNMLGQELARWQHNSARVQHELPKLNAGCYLLQAIGDKAPSQTARLLIQ